MMVRMSTTRFKLRVWKPLISSFRSEVSCETHIPKDAIMTSRRARKDEKYQACPSKEKETHSPRPFPRPISQQSEISPVSIDQTHIPKVQQRRFLIWLKNTGFSRIISIFTSWRKFKIYYSYTQSRVPEPILGKLLLVENRELFLDKPGSPGY